MNQKPRSTRGIVLFIFVALIVVATITILVGNYAHVIDPFVESFRR